MAAVGWDLYIEEGVLVLQPGVGGLGHFDFEAAVERRMK